MGGKEEKERGEKETKRKAWRKKMKGETNREGKRIIEGSGKSRKGKVGEKERRNEEEEDRRRRWKRGRRK